MLTNIKKNKHNLKIIRRFDEDIWATLAVKTGPSQVLNYIFESHQNNFKYRKLLKKKRLFWSKRQNSFSYKVVTEEKEFKRKKRTIKINNYINLLKLRCFYGGLGTRKFKRLFEQMSLNTNTIGRSFAYLVESRVDVILYRANFFTSIYAAKQAINHGKVFVNGVVLKQASYKASLNDVITCLLYTSPSPRD